MNNKIKIISLLAAFAMTFAAVSPAFAQEDSPPRRGEHPLSEYIFSAFAATVGLTEEEVKSRLDNGETLKQIAESLGYSETRSTVISTAITEAVSAGVITQEQADRMANREHRKGQFGGERREAMLENLGLTQGELRSLLDSGMTMQEIFEQQGVEMQFGGGSRIGEGGPGGKLADHCGLAQEELQAGLDSGQTIQDMCPDLERPKTGRGPRNTAESE